MNEAAIVLAAGQGTRMRSSLPKVLHLLAGKTMLGRVLQALSDVGYHQPTVVVGYQADLVRREIAEAGICVAQEQQLGTGHAVRVALDSLPSDIDRVLVINGDEPLIPPDILRRMLDLQVESGAAVVLLTTHLADTRGFGRVVRDSAGKPVALLQESDLTPEQQTIDEVNLGAYVFDARRLRRCLADLKPHPPKDEYYVTDVVAMVARDAESGRPGTVTVTVPGGSEVLGINDLTQLEEATRALYQRTNRRFMERGVTIVNSASTFIDDEAEIEPDTVIEPFTIISGHTRIGPGCIIGPQSRLIDAQIGADCRVVVSTVERSTLQDGVWIGPYSRVRGGSHVGAGAYLGNFAEVNQSVVGADFKMHHFSYVGNATVGSRVNIGAGTVTCNYDGNAKHRTTIEDQVFIGSDTMLIAPVTVGTRSSTGAGSVVTRDVPPGTTVVGVPAHTIKRSQETPSGAAEQARRKG